MFDEIIEEKKVCIKKERFTIAYLAILFLKILLCCCHMDWCLKFVGFLRDIKEDDKNNDS